MSACVDKEIQLFNSRVHPCRDDSHCCEALQSLSYLISLQRINVRLVGRQMYSTSVNPSIQEQTDSPQVTFIHPGPKEQPSGDYHPSWNKRTALGSPSSIQEQTDRPQVNFIHPGTNREPSGDLHPSRNKGTSLKSPSSIQEQTDSLGVTFIHPEQTDSTVRW